MPSLPAVSGLQAVAAFEHLGFAAVRTKGSHRMMKKPGHPFVLSVPLHKTLKPGTLRGLIRDAGIDVEKFCELLDL